MRLISEVARDISRAWPKPHFTAKPYLDAMKSLGTASDQFGLESAKSIVLYFLSNAAAFRGPQAKALKQELKEIIK